MEKIVGYHKPCGKVDIEILTEEDGSKWEICQRCGETIREVTI